MRTVLRGSRDPGKGHSHSWVLLLPLLARDSLRLRQVWGRGKARIGSGFKSHLCLFLTVGLCTSHVPSLGLGQLVIK